MTRSPAVFLLDASPLYRAGLRKALLDSEYHIAGESESISSTLTQLKNTSVDALIIGYLVQEQDYLDTLEAVASIQPSIKVIFIVSPDHSSLIELLIQSGADGVLCSTSPMDTIRFAFNQVLLRKDLFIDSRFSEQLFFSERQSDKMPLIQSTTIVNHLSHREGEVFSLLVGGMSVKEISIQLSRSPKTIDNHKTKIMKKLGVSSHYELLQFAQKAGLSVYP